MIICCATLILALLLAAQALGQVQPKGIAVIVTNTGKSEAPSAPVSAGIPFPKKALADPSALALVTDGGKPVPLQAETLSRWPDGSSKWVLLDFQPTLAAASEARFTLVTSGKRPLPENPVTVSESPSAVTLSNGAARFEVRKGDEGGVLSSHDGKASARIVSSVRTNPATGPRVTP